MIFAPDQGLELLSNSEHWFCNGTSKGCPEIFIMFTQSTLWTSSTLLVHIIAEQEPTNQFFFREVLILGPGILQVIVFDFEQAAMNTMQLLSLNMEIRDCFMSHQTFDIGNIATLLYSKKGERWGVFFER